MTNFTPKISKLSLAADQEIVGDAFIADAKELNNKLGVVFGLIELIRLPDDIVDRILDVLADLKTEYYLPPFEIEYGVERRFEECLQRANRRLYKMILECPAEIELENINILLGLSHRQKIYLSRSGKINAFLFHAQKRHDHLIIDIFASAGEKKIKFNPEKMFSNIISGSLGALDNVMFANDAVLEHLSQNELMAIARDNTALGTVREIEKILQTEELLNNIYLIAIQPDVKADEEKQTSVTALRSEILADTAESLMPQHSINKLITTQEKTEQYLTPSLMPNWQKISLLILIFLKKSLLLALKYLKLSALWLSQKLGQLLRFAVRKIRRSQKVKSLSESDQTAASWPETTTKETDKILKSPPVGHGLVQESWRASQKIVHQSLNYDWYKKMLPLGRQHLPWPQRISDWLNNQLAKFFNLNKLQQTLIIIVFILVFAFSQSVVWQGKNQTTNSADLITQLTKEIEDKINTAQAQNIFNDEAGAKISLAQAQELWQQIPDRRKYQTTRKNLEQKISELNQALQKITYLDNPQVVADFKNQNANAQVNSLSKAGSILFAFDQQNQSLYRVDIAQAQTTAATTSVDLKTVKKIVAADNKTILFLNGNQSVFRYDSGQKTTEKIISSDQPIVDMALYDNKLYTLRPSQNQIFKHLPAGGAYNSGSTWVKDGSDLKNGLVLAIDSGIFVAKNNGEIIYLTAGKLKETLSPTLNPNLSTVSQVITETDSNYLYLLDPANKRIVVINKNGELKTQFTSKNFHDLKSIASAEKEKKIYLLSDNKIFAIDLNF